MSPTLTTVGTAGAAFGFGPCATAVATARPATSPIVNSARIHEPPGRFRPLAREICLEAPEYTAAAEETFTARRHFRRVPADLPVRQTAGVSSAGRARKARGPMVKNDTPAAMHRTPAIQNASW